MRKIFISTVVLIGIPFFIVIFFNKVEKEYTEKLINLKYVSSINVRVKRVSKNKIDNVFLEDYVVGAVAGEMPVSFDNEALKAQAVACRSYVLRKIEDNKNNSYDVVDTTSNQVYLDLDDMKGKWGNNYVNYLNKVRSSVNDTSMEYLEYDGKIANTMFFSTSNGYTEDSQVVFSEDVPYLRSVSSKWDKNVNNNFNYSITMSLSDFYKKLRIDYSKYLNAIIIKRSSSNRIVKIKINGVMFKGTDIYNKLGIRSTDFSLIQDGDNVIVKTQGFGHGVGMSQYGAYGMAMDGYGYREILNHYYKGTVLKKIKN